MQQRSLFETAPHDPGRSLIGIAGSAPTLTAAQKKFNALIDRIKQQRRELDEWRAFGGTYHQHLADHYLPALDRLRQTQVCVARWLDELLDGKALGQRECNKVRDILLNMLAEVLADHEDPELVRLQDKHAPRDPPEEFAEWHDAPGDDGHPQPQSSRPRKKSAQELAREALAEQAAQGGSRAVRDIFRKLASELHPDRETDPVEHSRKTELMQRVNRAYKAGDLLTLLELQLSLEQIDPQALAGLSDERLRHYIHVLEEQSRQLRDELEEFLAPFAAGMAGAPLRTLSPAGVQQALDADIRHIRRMVRQLEADFAHFQDLAAFRRSLREYRIERPRRSRHD